MDLPTPPLTIDEASDAVVHWLTQTAWEDVSVEAAADGLVEFGGQNLVARLRWDSAAVSQAAVLALLRAQEDDERLILFSVSGFTPGADALATAQGVALFDLGPDGSAKPIGTVAERLVPRIEPTPAFPPQGRRGTCASSFRRRPRSAVRSGQGADRLARLPFVRRNAPPKGELLCSLRHRPDDGDRYEACDTRRGRTNPTIPAVSHLWLT